MQSVNTHNNFFYFTAALVFLLLGAAMLNSLPDTQNQSVLQGAMLISQLVAYFSLHLNPLWRRFFEGLIVLLLLAIALRHFTDWRFPALAGLGVSLLFYIGMAYIAGRQVLFSGCIEGNTIVGTVAVYLLLGLIWAVLYLMALEFWPNGLSGVDYRPWHENFGIATYYSFVTMTTLGYGDILPTVPITRTLAYLQAICGVFYMAVVVASLISGLSRAAK